MKLSLIISWEHSQVVSFSVVPLNVVACHPLKGQRIPIFLHKTWDFGEHLDAHLGMPCMNTKDLEFAKSMNLTYQQVVDNFGLMKESGKFTGLDRDETAEGVVAAAWKANQSGYWTSDKARDWCISRQRYWGTPIPMLHCKASGAVPVPTEQLPVILPEVNSFRGTNGKSPLALASADWLSVPCPKSE